MKISILSDNQKVCKDTSFHPGSLRVRTSGIFINRDRGNVPDRKNMRKQDVHK